MVGSIHVYIINDSHIADTDTHTGVLDTTHTNKTSVQHFPTQPGVTSDHLPMYTTNTNHKHHYSNYKIANWVKFTEETEVALKIKTSSCQVIIKKDHVI